MALLYHIYTIFQLKELLTNTFFRGSKTKAPISRGYSLSKPFISEWVECIYGGSDEDRTRYLLHAMEALSQVSYGPTVRYLLYNNSLIRQQFFINN